MSESAPRINPEDVFPRRNLPGSAEQWGRVVEDRTRELEKNAVAVNQSLHGANRDTAAQLANLAPSVARLTSTNTVRMDWFYVEDGAHEETKLTEITPPAWANYAHVSATFNSLTIGFPSKTVRSTVSVLGFNSGSLGQSWQPLMNARFGNGLSHAEWVPEGEYAPRVVDLTLVPTLQISTRVYASSAGTGGIEINAFYPVTFIA